MKIEPPPLQWDIFCRVIDNFGDIGVCWRLAQNLVQRDHTVRLWIDDAAALSWMADAVPLTSDGRIRIMQWTTPLTLTPASITPAADVLVEAFGCDVPPEFIAACRNPTELGDICMSTPRKPPVWLNLEYLSAEPYVERNHTLPSLQTGGPATGLTKWFFYPGFTAQTGGLLRESHLKTRLAHFDRNAWLDRCGLPAHTEKRVSLFCYEPLPLQALITEFREHGLDGEPVRLFVTAGRSAAAVSAALNHGVKTPFQQGLLSVSYLPLLAQTDYDHLLWACDLNFVRGEDSLVRAIWAGKPWVWQIYPQTDGAHQTKLQALMDTLHMPESLRAFHTSWNFGHVTSAETSVPTAKPLHAFQHSAMGEWQVFAEQVRTTLWTHSDLTTQLVDFVERKKR